MILRAFRRTPETHRIAGLYGAIVAQARLPVFYTHYGVPDTVEGRFELLVLHMVLLLRRLGREAGTAPGRGRAGRAAGQEMGQELFDRFCRDLDHNLREMGVGDLSVPKRMRGFAEAFYGRQAAYTTALGSADAHELEKALARNIFAETAADERALRLARYARAAARALDTEEEGTLAADQAAFPSPETFIDA
jgi:cytochrome b pre-mRNA-processing protein 3